MPPFQPGQSGNPGGKPKGYVNFANVLRQELMKTDRRNRPHLEAIATKVVAMAMRGDMDAVRWLADRVDGKVAQNLNVNQEQTVHVVPWLPAIQGALPEGPEGETLQEQEGLHLVDLSVEIEAEELEVVEGGEEGVDDGGERSPDRED